ncbi:P-loop NTPase fold protein [Serratia liquefaciens]|uniref:KAP family P-loop NTPase fold protein n=1 Tax=Serratia liquefaciens TaxID=614 RepID=UPI0039C65AB6
MRLTTRELDYSHGFTNENDIFNRRRFATQLETIILNSQDESLVFAIDDKWGSGKTTFLKMWEGKVIKEENPNLKIIYFDAFEHDYQQDAFLALASKIYGLIDKESSTLKKKFIDSAKVVGRSLFSIATKVGVNIATAGLVNGSAIESASDTVADAITKPIDKFIEEKIKGAKQEEDSLTHFKETLELISKDKKIIFIIDELDRARPDFSLEILEKIKHVFSAKNFIFMLSMNREQFEKTIIKRYGDINASLYLSKFITHWFTLPKESETKTTALSRYCEHLYNVMLDSNREFETSYDTLTRLLTVNKTSLREAEKAFGFMALTLASIKNKVPDTRQAAIAISTYLTIIHPNSINDVLDNEMTLNKIILLLNIPSIQENIDEFISKIINSEFLPTDEYSRLVTEKSELVMPPQSRRPTFIKNALNYITNMYIDSN